MIDALSEIEIAAPRDVVAAYAADPNNAPRWYRNIMRVDWKTPSPLAVGSRLAFVARFLGRRLEYTYEVIEFVPAERLVMRTAERPFPMETTYTWESVGDATRMTLRNRGSPAGFFRFLAAVMESVVRRENRKDLAHLKKILEARHTGRR